LTEFPVPLLIACAGSFVISCLLTALLIRFASRLRLVDEPGPRKVHTCVTPKGGGLAVYIAAALGTFLLPSGWSGTLALLLGIAAVIVLLGLVDDLRPLPWQLRLAVQVTAAVAVVVLLPADWAWFVRAAAVVWIVGLTNAFNMLDNMDALSGGVAWIAAGVLALLCLARSPSFRDGDGSALLGPMFLLMAALSGFLWFNWPPARIFMGDAGSTFLGFFLGVYSLVICDVDTSPQSWAVPVCVLAVPWYDLIAVVTIRLCQGRSPFHADKQHLSHRLVELGLSSPAAVRVIYLLALASGVGGVVLYGIRDTEAAVLLGCQMLCWWTAIAAIELGVRAGKQESGVRSQESGVRSQESGVRSQESGVRSQDSGVRTQDSGLRSQESGVRREQSNEGVDPDP
jgi:UDP-GlcNAc:undecaprenyl-phosphate GlcNAc-1-phosphate transferase